MGFRRLKIHGFKGLDTQKGDFHEDASVSPDAVNFICADGVMKTAGGTREYAARLPVQGARLFQAFFRDGGNGADRSVLMASGGGGIYALVNGAWKQIGSGYGSDEWESVSYRRNDEELILMVNGRGGMAAWDGKSERVTGMNPVQGGEEIRFEHLTLLYERLWGAVHADAPDRIYWSESFEPDNWEVDYTNPDEGGGFIDVATFDGSRIRAVKAAFDDVLIFKDKSMHRLNGTYPGEFSLTQVYGSEGTLAAKTIVSTASRLYFLGWEGLCVYNGMSVQTLMQAGERKLTGIWERMNREAITGACAAVFGDTMYLALPLDGAEENSHVIEYRLHDGTCSLVKLAGVREFLAVREEMGERLICLIGDRIYAYGEGGMLAGEPVEARWLSPVITPSSLDVKRTVSRMGMVIEAENGGAVRLVLTDGEKERTTVIPLKQGVNVVRQRMRIRGRTFRFSIENVDGCGMRLPDGLEILMEERER